MALLFGHIFRSSAPPKLKNTVYGGTGTQKYSVRYYQDKGQGQNQDQNQNQHLQGEVIDFSERLRTGTRTRTRNRALLFSNDIFSA